MELKQKHISLLEAITIIIICLLPLIINFPYRINIFLSWEGAYRLSQGQIPFKDFGIPLGFVYWIIPAIFFKIFGPMMITLVKAQVFLNIVAVIVFRGILNILGVKPVERFLTILIFCLTFILLNFWPWYNSSVFIYQLLSIYFILYGLKSQRKYRIILAVAAGALFSTLAFFTKQDGGGLTIILNLVLLAYYSATSRKLWHMTVYLISLILLMAVFIVPFVAYDFNYWFNYGQYPHTSRIDLKTLVDFWLGGSYLIKLYLVAIILIIAADIKKMGVAAYFKDSEKMIFALLTLGILAQAAIIQVTSYVPPDNNIYFHSFSSAFILSNIRLPFSVSRVSFISFAVIMIMFWWSGRYYKYFDRIISRLLPESASSSGVSVSTYRNGEQLDSENSDESMLKWVFIPEMRVFDGIYMPESTVEGIRRLKELDIFKKPNPKVLNMTELTPLAYELGFELERGSDIPLWHHLNVSMFERELKAYKEKINNNYYDIVLFEYIPNLNNFYPFEVRDILNAQYKQIDSFAAPRRHGGQPLVEVFIKKEF